VLSAGALAIERFGRSRCRLRRTLWDFNCKLLEGRILAGRVSVCSSSIYPRSNHGIVLRAGSLDRVVAPRRPTLELFCDAFVCRLRPVRHLNSQTSGPRRRSARITLPFAWISSPFGHGLPAGTIQAQIVFRQGPEYATNVGEDVRGYCFAEITIANVSGKAVDAPVFDYFRWVDPSENRLPSQQQKAVYLHRVGNIIY